MSFITAAFALFCIYDGFKAYCDRGQRYSGVATILVGIFLFWWAVQAQIGPSMPFVFETFR